MSNKKIITYLELDNGQIERGYHFDSVDGGWWLDEKFHDFAYSHQIRNIWEEEEEFVSQSSLTLRQLIVDAIVAKLDADSNLKNIVLVSGDTLELKIEISLPIVENNIPYE